MYGLILELYTNNDSVNLINGTQKMNQHLKTVSQPVHFFIMQSYKALKQQETEARV